MKFRFVAIAAALWNLAFADVEEQDAEDPIEEIRKEFIDFDLNKDDHVDAQEVRMFISNEHPEHEINEEQLNAIFRKADVDGDGRLSFVEYVNLLQSEDDIDLD